MKRFFILLLLICWLLTGCLPGLEQSPVDTQAPAEISTDTPAQITIDNPPPAPTIEAPVTEPALPAGWFEENGVRYYRLEDGTLATGAVTIDGVTRHFTSTGAYVVVVNPWNPVPEDYVLDLVELSVAVSVSGSYVDASCHDAMTQMILDCNTYSGSTVCVVSAYRSVELQTSNFNNKVQKYLDAGYDYKTAYAEAAAVIAVPGTSEHHLGLAADIIDTQNWGLVQEQENLTGQKWLMENCWKYGFILRYPADKRDVTGIIYEPWHYRYVGTELAAELHELGITLEEYMGGLTVVDSLPPA